MKQSVWLYMTNAKLITLVVDPESDHDTGDKSSCGMPVPQIPFLWDVFSGTDSENILVQSFIAQDSMFFWSISRRGGRLGTPRFTVS